MDDARINRALLFAADWFVRSCRNPGKPVYLHSLRVAELCRRLDYAEDVVITAILHDLIEDTDCRAQDIEAAFGRTVAEAVQALTDNPAIPDRLARSLDSISRCATCGSAALAVRCLDAADNCRFFSLADPQTQCYLAEKYRGLARACARREEALRALQCLLDEMQAQGITLPEAGEGQRG